MTPEPEGTHDVRAPMAGRTRGTWTLLDQVIVSVRNFAALLLVIKASDADVVGAFGIVYTTYFLLMAVVRGLAGDPLVVRYAGASHREWARATSESLATVVVVALLCGCLGTVPLAVSRGEVWIGLCALGWFSCLLLAQDHLRLAMFARARPDQASRNDLLVLLVSLICFAGLWRLDLVTIPSVLAAWALASAVGTIVALRTLQLRVVWRAWSRWLRQHRDLGPAFAADAVANRGTDNWPTSRSG